MSRKVRNLRKVATELRHTPEGFHQEVWSYENGSREIVLYTSEYLSLNSWTIGHDPDEKKLDEHIHELQEAYRYDDVTLERILKEAALAAWQ